MLDPMPNLFVYGSLRKGFYNHHYLGLAGSSRFVMEARLPGARLYRTGRYPVMVLTGVGADSVEGEIYDDLGGEVFEAIKRAELDAGLLETRVTVEGIPCLTFVSPPLAVVAELVPSGRWGDARPVLNVAIVVFPGVEELDFVGPLEVFANWSGDQERLSVFTVSESSPDGLVRCDGGLVIQPHFSLEKAPPIDILVVPGGPGRRLAMDSALLTAFVAERAQAAVLTLSVCTGAFIAAKAGILKNRKTTTYVDGKQDHELAATGLVGQVIREARYVVDGPVISAGGVSAGIDGALEVVARLYGGDAAMRVASTLNYHWRSEPDVAGARLP